MKSCEVETNLLIHIEKLLSKMKKMITTTTLREKPESLEHETSLEANTNPTENTQQNPLANPKVSYFYDTYWTSTKTTFRIETTILWIFLIRTYSSWERTFNITASKKNRICKSKITKRRTGTQSIAITIKSTWYGNPLWQNYSTKISNDTFESKKATSTISKWSFFSIPLTILLHVMTERQERAFVTDAISSTETLINNPTISLPSEKHWGHFFNCSC